MVTKQKGRRGENRMQDYVATGKYKSENISGNQFMLKEDREFFDQYGLTLERQAALIAEDYCYGQDNSLYDFIADLEEHEGEYVVNGALLTCSQGTKQTWKIKVDGVLMESVPQEVEENSRIRIEEREQSFGGLVPAGITDTLGGLRGEELLAGGGTENERELNIVSFGNCRFIAQGEELDEILKKKKLTGNKSKIIEAIKEGKGTCYCMMKLNEEWENLAIAGEYMTGQVKMPTAGIDRLMLGGSYMKFNGIEGINMLSILFCQFGGGIITALESGQNVFSELDYFVPFNLKEQKAAGSKLAKKLLAIGFSQDKVDAIIEATKEIYRKHGVVIDPVCLLAIIGQEGTGSFNTSSTNLAADGQHGVEKDFGKDLVRANNLIFGKVLGYMMYEDEFVSCINNNKELLEIDNANIAQYANWRTPYPGFSSHKIVNGSYAGHSKWHEGVTSFYEGVRGSGSMQEYSNYLSAFDEEDAYQIMDDLGINVEKEEGEFKVERIGQDSGGREDGSYIVTWTAN